MCVSSACDDETVHGAVRWQAKSCYDYPRGSGGGEESVGVCEVGHVIGCLVGGQLTAVGRD